MFEVLVFVYENFWHGDDCPEHQELERELSAAGFASEQVNAALAWLDGLNQATRGAHWLPGVTPGARQTCLSWEQAPTSMRVYAVSEQNHLGLECLSFIRFLETSGGLPSPLREIVLDRAMAAPGETMSLDDLKLIILMVYWSFGEEPDALVLDELCDDILGRVAH